MNQVCSTSSGNLSSLEKWAWWKENNYSTEGFIFGIKQSMQRQSWRELADQTGWLYRMTQRTAPQSVSKDVFWKYHRCLGTPVQAPKMSLWRAYLIKGITRNVFLALETNKKDDRLGWWNFPPNCVSSSHSLDADRCWGACVSAWSTLAHGLRPSISLEPSAG